MSYRNDMIDLAHLFLIKNKHLCNNPPKLWFSDYNTHPMAQNSEDVNDTP